MYTPAVDDIGHFKFKAPFDNILENDVRYVTVGVSSISLLTKAGRDVKAELYLSNGLTESDYNEAFKNKVAIVSLEHDSGDVFEIPADYIGTIPLLNGVEYSDKALVIQLGTLPNKYDLSEMKTKVLQLAKNYINVPMTIEDKVVSSTIYYTDEQHDANMSFMFAPSPVLETIETLRAEKIRHIATISSLEEHIRNSST